MHPITPVTQRIWRNTSTGRSNGSVAERSRRAASADTTCACVPSGSTAGLDTLGPGALRTRRGVRSISGSRTNPTSGTTRRAASTADANAAGSSSTSSSRITASSRPRSMIERHAARWLRKQPISPGRGENGYRGRCKARRNARDRSSSESARPSMASITTAGIPQAARIRSTCARRAGAPGMLMMRVSVRTREHPVMLG